MAYKIEMLPDAEKELAALSQKLQRRIALRIDALAENPRPAQCRKLRGDGDDFYRIRIADYRILYRIRDEVLTVLVVRIGDRREVYRRIPGWR